jgi:DNA-binding MarR family transcriptional regulator
MSERTRAANVFLAVQEGMRQAERDRMSDRYVNPSGSPITAPGSVTILEELRGQESRPIADIADATELTRWTVLKTISTLEKLGLVSVDAAAETVALTTSGRTAIGE